MKGTVKGQEKTFRSDGYVHYVDFGAGVTVLYVKPYRLVHFKYMKFFVGQS